jgi:hypothetical protein
MCVGGDSTAGGDTICIDGDSYVVGDMINSYSYYACKRKRVVIIIIIIVIIYGLHAGYFKLYIWKKTVLLGNITH